VAGIGVAGWLLWRGEEKHCLAGGVDFGFCAEPVAGVDAAEF
jgi:hypothetical protein